MRSLAYLLLVVSLGAGPATGPATRPATGNGVTVYFSPHGGATAAIVERIDAAKTSIKIQAYRLVSAPIAKAIVEAHRRGVDVTIILDKRQQSAKYSDATFFHNAGMDVMIDHKHAIAHNKIMIMDDHTIITGSFNFSMSAEEDNAENLLIIRDNLILSDAYVQNFAAHLAHAIPYMPPVNPFEGPPATTQSVDIEIGK